MSSDGHLRRRDHSEIMADLFQVADSDASPNDADRGAPSIEAIAAAFRKAAGGRARRAVPGGKPSAWSVLAPPSTPTLSPAEIVEETTAAFRKAGRRATGRSEAPPARDLEGKASEVDLVETASGEGAEASAGAEGNETDSDDLALAFRRALSRWGQASADESSGGAHRESERSVETSPEAKRRPSSGKSSPLVDTSSSPPRPDASFLWVTDAPDATGAISVEDLSAPRARQAAAFLLRGEGDRPYQLLTHIRRHPETSIYLKPVFWRRAEGQQSPVADHVDGTWTPAADEETLDALRDQAAAINQRVSALIELEDAEAGPAEHRVLRFVATRSAEFAPRRVSDSGGGERIVFPKLTPLLEQSPRSEDWSGYELAEILSATAQYIREKQSSRS